MIEYQICNVENEDVFYKQCFALEKHIPNLIKGEFIEADVLYQEYFINDKRIIVLDDEEDGVIIRSEIPLEPYFKKWNSYCSSKGERMKISECENKKIKVTCKNGNVFSGFCDEYLSAAESEDNRACIYVDLSPHVCVELFEDKIAKIEEIQST